MLNSSMSMSYSIRKYKFRFRAQTTTDTMSQEGTKRIQPKRQTLDDAYSPPGEPPVFSYHQALKLGIFSANFLEIILSDPITHGDNRKDLLQILRNHSEKLSSLIICLGPDGRITR